MPRIEVASGFHLNVELMGSGPPLVLLHGFTGSAQNWGAFANLLKAHFTIVAPDIVGHGLSDSPSELDHYRMPRAVDDLVTAVAIAGFDSSTWLGYSMGGRTALHVAAAHPGTVERLILIGASAGIAGASERRQRAEADEALASRIERDGVAAFVDYWESIPLFDSQRQLPTRIRDEVRAGRLANNATGLANSLRGMGTGAQAPLHDRLATIAMPVLAMAGELDTKFCAAATELAAALPDCRAETVPGAGHAAQLEQPQWCAEHVLAFTQVAQGATT